MSSMTEFHLTGDEVTLCDAVETGTPIKPRSEGQLVLRAEALRRIMMGEAITEPGSAPRRLSLHPGGLVIYGATVIGSLLLDDAAMSDSGMLPPLTLSGCNLESVSLCRARFRHLSLANSRLKHLNAVGLQIGGLLDLSCISSSEETGETSGALDRGLCWVELREADIGGSVYAAGATLVAPTKTYSRDPLAQRGEYAFDLRSATIGHELILSPRFSALGGVSIRSTVIDRDVIAAGAVLSAVDDLALSAAGARIGGSALFFGATLDEKAQPFVAQGSVSFLDSSISGSLDFRGAVLSSFAARNSEIGGAVLLSAWVAGEHVLQFRCERDVSLDATRVSGKLDLAGATCRRLSAENTEVGGSISIAVFKENESVLRFSAVEGVFFQGTKVAGNLDARGASIRALKADNAQIGGAAFLRQWYDGGTATPFAAREDVSLIGIRIAGNLEMTGASLGDLFASNADIGGAAFLNTWSEKGAVLHFTARSLVSLAGTRIGGNLEMTGASLDRLLAGHADIGGAVFLNTWFQADKFARFTARNEVSLTGSRIGGNVETSGADIDCLRAQNADIGGSMLLRSLRTNKDVLPFACQSDLFVVGSKIRADFDISGADLRAKSTADNLSIGGSIWMKSWMDRATSIHESISFSGCRVEGSLVVGAFDVNPSRPVKVDLSHCVVTVLDDENGEAWGKHVILDLQGLCYERVATSYATSRPRPWLASWAEARDLPKVSVSRINWLSLQYPLPNRDPNFYAYNPDAYDRLARVFRTSGFYGDARAIIREKLRVERLVLKGPFTRPFLAIFAMLFDSGLSPKRALATYLVFVMLGGFATDVANGGYRWLNARSVLVLDTSTMSSLAVAASDSANEFRPGLLISEASKAATEEFPCGHEIEPYLYALDVFTPALEIHQERRCSITVKPEGRLWRFGRAIYAILGWIVTALAVLTVSGVMRRQLES